MRNGPLEGYGYRDGERSYTTQRYSQAPRIMASRILRNGKGIDGFLKSIPGVRTQRDVRRKLLCGGRVFTWEVTAVSFIQPVQPGVDNIMDAALISAKIQRSPGVWAKLERDSRRRGVRAWAGCDIQAMK